MQVRDLMSREVVTIRPTESYLDAVVRMQRARARHLPSCDPLWWSPWSCWPRPFNAGQRCTSCPGRVIFRDQGCYGRHTVGATGTPIATDLSRIGAKRNHAYLARWIRDPSLQRPTAHMPKIQLSEGEVQALAAYLGSLR